jgi:hypothetical protein
MFVSGPDSVVSSARVEADYSISHPMAGAGVVNVGVTATTSSRVADAAALACVSYGKARDPRHTRGERVLAALDKPPAFQQRAVASARPPRVLVMGSLANGETANPRTLGNAASD